MGRRAAELFIIGQANDASPAPTSGVSQAAKQPVQWGFGTRRTGHSRNWLLPRHAQPINSPESRSAPALPRVCIRLRPWRSSSDSGLGYSDQIFDCWEEVEEGGGGSMWSCSHGVRLPVVLSRYPSSLPPRYKGIRLIPQMEEL